MTEKKFNELRFCVLAYDGIQDTLMLMKYNRPRNIIKAAESIIKTHRTEDNFVKGARQMIEEVKALKPIEKYPELWI